MARSTAGSPDCSGTCRCGATAGVSAIAASRRSPTSPGSIEEMRSRRRPSRRPAARTRSARSAPEPGSRKVPMLMPVSTSSGWPSSMRRRPSARIRAIGRLSARPRVVGMMQKAQRESQPFCTFRNARVRPGAAGASSAQAVVRPPPSRSTISAAARSAEPGSVVTAGPANWAG